MKMHCTANLGVQDLLTYAIRTFFSYGLNSTMIGSYLVQK